MRGVDKRVAQGTEELLTRNEWCSVMGIHGKDPDVLLHPTMELAFSRILERFKPKHRVAYLGLCSSIRPYSQSRKWAVVAPLLQDKADLIITSNGGVIPIEYEGAFSYLNYDAHGHSRYDDLYIKVLTKRLLAFFRTHRYETLCFHYRVGLRNREAARIGGGQLLREGAIERYTILPTVAQRDQARREGWPTNRLGCKMHPEIYPAMLQPALDYVAQYAGGC